MPSCGGQCNVPKNTFNAFLIYLHFSGIVQLRQCKMSRLLPTSFLVLVAVTLMLLIITTSAEPKPGHMQHQYYKEQERQRQRASRKAEWGEYAHQHSGAAVEHQQHLVLELVGLLAVALVGRYNHNLV